MMDFIRLPCGHLLRTPDRTLLDHLCRYDDCEARYRIERSRKGGFYTRPV